MEEQHVEKYKADVAEGVVNLGKVFEVGVQSLQDAIDNGDYSEALAVVGGMDYFLGRTTESIKAFADYNTTRKLLVAAGIETDEEPVVEPEEDSDEGHGVYL